MVTSTSEGPKKRVRCGMIRPHHPDCECATCKTCEDELCSEIAIGTAKDGRVRVCAGCAEQMESEGFPVDHDAADDMTGATPCPPTRPIPTAAEAIAMARAAIEDDKRSTPAPWEWWTSNSFRRLTGPDGVDGGVMHAFVCSDGQPDISISERDLCFIESARTREPALARFVEAVCAFLEDLPHQGVCGEIPGGKCICGLADLRGY